ncbi:MAG: hypothetical protein EAY75_01115, partial [Bacteroidetes bacterium]
YGTPSQEQLDALFGTEVGYNNYYQKTMVRDANGQFSVSYTDMTGKTIATALAGEPPANNLPDTTPSLERLPSFNSKILTEALLSPINNYIQGSSLISNSSILVSKPDVHTFAYSLSPESLSDTACSNPSKVICYDCLYDLTISISTDCGNQGLAYANGQSTNGQPLIVRKTNIPLTGLPLDSSCLTAPLNVDTSFSVFLPAGGINITKTLAVSAASMAHYREVYVRNNLCRTQQDFITEWTDSVRNGTACQTNAEQNCAACSTLLLGGDGPYISDFFNKRGLVPQGPGDPVYEEAMASYKRLEEDCKQLCSYNDADNYRQLMLDDVSPPFGQFARPHSANECDPSHDPTNSATWRGIFSVLDERYSNPNLTYKDELGKPAMVWHNGQLLQPQRLPPCAFADNFVSSWAETLLPLHPEYNRLLKFESYKPSHLWNAQMDATNTYAAAAALGMLSPVGSVGAGYPSALQQGVTDALFLNPANPIHARLTDIERDAFKNSLLSYQSVNHPTTGAATMLNLWQFVNYTIVCLKPGTTVTAAQFDAAINPTNVFSTSYLCAADLERAWQLFRQFYLQSKHELVMQKVQSEMSLDLAAYLNAPVVSRFMTANAAIGRMGLTLPITTANAQSVNATRLAAQATSTCASYVQYWLAQLEPCGTLSQADSAELMSKLITVCQNGFDAQHPFGASTANPAVTYPPGTPTSFIAVIEAWARAKGRFPTCNGYLIQAPKPFNTPAILAEKPVFEKPDSCACARLATLAAEKTARAYTGTLSGYLQHYYNTTLPQGQIDTLLGKCNGTLNPTCRFLPTPIMLPPALQCLPQPICRSCTEIRTLSDSFVTVFGAPLPTALLSGDTLILARQQLFSSFMNQQTGFGLAHSFTDQTPTHAQHCHCRTAHSRPIGHLTQTFPVAYTLQAKFVLKCSTGLGTTRHSLTVHIHWGRLLTILVREEYW